MLVAGAGAGAGADAGYGATKSITGMVILGIGAKFKLYIPFYSVGLSVFIPPNPTVLHTLFYTPVSTPLASRTTEFPW
ncbi:hypothetical protein M0804_004514 [Polistes exclamans]|nr:hypothetical protein M0804_004514 [Polistes exclamans]